MEGGEGLGLIAEIGIAVAGFAGVIATLRAPGGRMKAYAAFRIGIILGQSATAMLLALLPFALHYAGLGTGTIWSVSSSLMAAMTLFLLMWMPFRIGTRVAPPASGDRAPGFRWIATITFGLLGSIAVLQVVSVLYIRELWPYYVGLLVIMMSSLFQFAYVLFAPSRVEVST